MLNLNLSHPSTLAQTASIKERKNIQSDDAWQVTCEVIFVAGYTTVDEVPSMFQLLPSPKGYKLIKHFPSLIVGPF